MKFLVVDDDEALREVVTLFLENKFSAEVVQANSGNSAIELVKANTDIDYIISDYDMPNGNGGELYQQLLSVHSKIPFILLSSHNPDDCPEFKNQTLAGSFLKPFSTKTMHRALHQLFLDNGSAFPDSTPYSRVRVKTLLKINQLHCDLYMKLSETKYVKILNQGDSFGEEDLARFENKNVKYLYIDRKSSDVFLEKYTQDILHLVQTKENLSVEAVIEISNSAYEAIHDITHKFGFTPEVQRLAKVSLDLALTTIQTNPHLSDLLKRLSVDPDNYLSSHSVVLSHISCGIASLMGWNSESTAYKLSMASLLHDVTLDNDSMARIQTLGEINSSDVRFTSSEIKDIKAHPENSAGFVSKMSELPPDIDTIIVQHHERPNGSGFPHGINHTRISPLSATFIVAHDWVTFAEKFGEKANVKAFILQSSSTYDLGHFKKILLAMHNFK